MPIYPVVSRKTNENIQYKMVAILSRRQYVRYHVWNNDSQQTHDCGWSAASSHRYFPMIFFIVIEIMKSVMSVRQLFTNINHNYDTHSN